MHKHTSFRYNRTVGATGDVVPKYFGMQKNWAMQKFYYEIWLPFTMNKKRILFLAIVSYIALC